MHTISIDSILQSHAQFYLLQGNESAWIEDITAFFQNSNALIHRFSGSDIDVETVRNFIFTLNVQFDNLHIFLITDMEQCSVQTQNMLLKSIENLGENKIIIGLCQRLDGILSTVTSRASFFSRPSADSLQTKSFDDHRFRTKCANPFGYWSDLLGNTPSEALYNVFTSNNSNYQIQTLLREYYERLNANCNPELCGDLLLYKILEAE